MNEIIDNYNVNDETLEIDNSELEDIMLIEPGMMTIADEEEFFRLLKEAKLFIPIQMEKEEVFDIENQSVIDVIKPIPPLGFNFISLNMNDGERALVAFTRKEIMKEIKLKKDHIVMNMRDLAKILYGFGDVFSSIIINPQTEHSIMVKASTLIDLFKEKAKNPFIGSLEQTLATLKTKSVELDNHYMFFIRSEYEFMENEAKEGIFTAKMPLRASTDPNFQSNLPILHKIMMIQGQKIYYTGKSDDTSDFNVLIAPGSQFQKFYDEDGDTSVWRCINQPFYDDDEMDDE
ncbi:SseB family protein [Methanobrevibacter sp.]|uniref:SseB family protein n=1 Tax=Methanobrevibacter sp. TaxID=66852 RepID=UPI0025F9F194|nr:SseB family protein [Methanobrevibacter sp.]MBQ2962614.1 SseB family protein [Methanobrevibacter sp.]